jgi:uncharacterized double-CXXCG motif protein
MRIFEINPDDKSEAPGSDLIVERKWSLPGVRCDSCNATWSNTGLAYPSVDLSSLPSADRYEVHWPVPLAEFEQLKTQVAEMLPPDSVLKPGTSFGPLAGTIKGEFGDFVWVNSWTMLVKQRAYDLLVHEDVLMAKGVPASLMFQRTEPVVLLELEILPLARVSQRRFPDLDITRCQSCGRNPFKVPDKIEIEESSIPGNLDLFRIRDFSTVILGTETFVKAVQELRLSGILFEEVGVSSTRTDQ